MKEEVIGRWNERERGRERAVRGYKTREGERERVRAAIGVGLVAFGR